MIAGCFCLFWNNLTMMRTIGTRFCTLDMWDD